MKKKFLAVFLVLIYITTFTGCFNYRDIDKIIFATSIVYDVAPDSNVLVYLEAFKAQRTLSKGSEQSQRLVFRGMGKTVFEAIKDINLQSSYKINYTQIKAIIFSEKAARKGIKQFVDVMTRDPEFYLKPYMAVYLGSVEELLQGGFKEEQYVGLLISDLMRNIGTSSRAIRIRYADFLNARTKLDRASIMTAIQLGKNKYKNSVELNGGAVFVNDKMIDVIEKSETQAYNFMVDRVQSGVMEVINPNNKNKFISLEILKSKTKTDINYDNNKIYLTKKINVDTSVSESQGQINLDEANIKKVEINADKNLINNANKIFDKFKKKGIDIFNIQDDLENKYKIRENGLIKKTQLTIDPKVTIEGGGKTGSFE